MPHFAAPYVRNFAAILDTVGLLEGFALVPVEVRPRAVIRAMADWLQQQGTTVHLVDPTEDEWSTLRDTLFALPTTPRSLVVVVGTSEATLGVRTGLTYVNHRRDSVAKHLGCPLLWCGPPEFLNLTGEQAPDFWSIREIPLRIDVAPDTSGIDVSMPRIQEATTPPEEIRPLFEAAKAQGDGPNAARLGLRLARALAARAQLDEAEQLAEAARASFEAMPGGRGAREEAECKEMLGDVARARGKVEEARARYQEVLEVGERLGDERLTARAYHRLGMAAQEERDLDAAEGWYRKALGVLGKLGDEHSVARAYDDLAKLAWDQKDLDAAEAHTKKALATFEKLGDEHSAAISQVRLGAIAQAKLDFDAAQRSYEKALATFEKLHDEPNTAETAWLLGEAAYEKHNFGAAEISYKKLLARLERRVDASTRIQTIYGRLYEIALRRKDQTQANEWQRKLTPSTTQPVERLWWSITKGALSLGAVAGIIALLGFLLLILWGRSKAPLDCLLNMDTRSCTVACALDNASSCHELGEMYEKGRGKPKSDAQAARFYNLARNLREQKCENNSLGDCSLLGDVYQYGSIGVPRDEARALLLYQKACDGGNLRGCASWGHVLVWRRDPETRAQGIQLLRRACSGGERLGCIELDRLHEPP